MVTDLAALIERTEVKPSDTGIEELVKEFGLTFWSLPHCANGDEELGGITGIDEELIYSMGYALGDLPGNIRNNTNEFCNKIAGEILHSDGRISFNELQNKAAIYMIGYQSGLRAR